MKAMKSQHKMFLEYQNGDALSPKSMYRTGLLEISISQKSK